MEINCPGCGGTFNVDDDSYKKFKGEVRCRTCACVLQIESNVDEYSELPYLVSVTRKDMIEVSVPTKAPPQVVEDFKEAARCFNAKAYKGTVTMCRRSLETACDAKRAKGGNLSEKIANLHEQGIIDEPTYHLASGIRQFGNYGAHPKEDLLKAVGEQEAEFILRLTERVLKQL